MELRSRTWLAVIKLAVALSTGAAFAAMMLTWFADVPQVAIVLPVIVIGFTASWIQSSHAT